MAAEGRKDDNGKLPWWLLPIAPINEILSVLKWAAYEKQPKPYGPNNWQYVQEGYPRYYSAAMRHLSDFWERHERGLPMLDEESNLHVLAHAGCCIIFLLWFELVGNNINQPPIVSKNVACKNCSQEMFPLSGLQPNLYRCSNCAAIRSVEHPEVER